MTEELTSHARAPWPEPDGRGEHVQDDKFRKHPGYHADTRLGFSDERGNPQKAGRGVPLDRRAGNLIFRQGDDIVVAKGGSEAGQTVTAYGPSGVKGDSGAAALGGKATDPGRPVTHEDIVQGKIPGRDGYMPQRSNSNRRNHHETNI